MTSFEGETQRLNPPCVQCGGTAFIWGKMPAQTPNRFWVNQSETEGNWLNKLENIFSSGIETEARMCKRCYNIQVFGIVPEWDERLQKLLHV